MPPSNLAAHPAQTVWPRYDGHCLLNLVTSLAGHFGVSTGHAFLASPLPLDGIETVVLVVADGLGHFPLEWHLGAGRLPHLAALLDGGDVAYSTATSTFPSSTMIAMTTLHTGASPAQHGWLGTAIHAGGSVVDVLRQRDLLGGQPLPEPGALLSVGSLYRRLADAGVQTRVVTPAAFEGSFLNSWYFDGARSVPYDDLHGLPEAVARAAAGGGPRYVMAYWPGFDTVSHGAGPYSADAADAAQQLDSAFHGLLSRLPRDGSTLVILTADHGQSETPAHLAAALDDPRLLGLLAGPPAGENLVRYLNVRAGAEEQLAAQLEGTATLIRAADAWRDGLFGGPPARDSFRERTGEWIAVAQRGHQLTWAYPAEAARVWDGTHGSLAAEQMVVPVIAVRR